WVSSTVPVSVSTFWLTPPTSVRTNFLVAHAGATATVSASSDTATRLLRIIVFSPLWTTRLMYLAGTQAAGHVAATRADDKVVLSGSNFERVPALAFPRLEAD